MGKSCGLPSGERAIPCLVAPPSSASLAASGVIAYLFPPHIRLFPGIRYSYVIIMTQVKGKIKLTI